MAINVSQTNGRVSRQIAVEVDIPARAGQYLFVLLCADAPDIHSVSNPSSPSAPPASSVSYLFTESLATPVSDNVIVAVYEVTGGMAPSLVAEKAFTMAAATAPA